MADAPVFDATQHGDVQALPPEFAATVERIAWLSSLLIWDDLNWFERLSVRSVRAGVERTARAALRQKKATGRTHPI
jgi:hypothetical protein